MPTDPLKLAALMSQAISSAPNVGSAAWQRDVEQIIARGHMAAWMAGTAERLGVPVDSPLLSRTRLSRAERAEVQKVIDGQLHYFRGFQAEIVDMSPAQVMARAQLYAGAVRKTLYEARWGDWEIPSQLMPGTAQCLGNCRCSVSVRDNGDGTGVLTRILGGSRHCAECPALAGDHPVKRRRAA